MNSHCDPKIFFQVVPSLMELVIIHLWIELVELLKFGREILKLILHISQSAF
jgi:hypothetical protein